MATANFYNHENGIYIVNEPEREDAINSLLENGYEENEINDGLIDDELNFLSSVNIEWFMRDLYETLNKKYYVEEVEENSLNIYTRKYNRKDKLVANVYIKDGYYQGYQVIVETNPVNLFPYWNFYSKKELLEEYTPNHKTLLKIIKSMTTPINLVGKFSNGGDI